MSASVALPPLEEILQLTDINAIQRLLQDAVTLESQLTAQLDVLLTKTESIDAKLDFIDIVPSKLKPITKEARDLHMTISRTCVLADSVSKKVRDLDTTRERVKTTMKKVEDIVDVRNCIDGVGKALAQERYEEAAGYVARYLSIAATCEELIDPSSVLALKEAAKKLEAIAEEKLAKATEANNPSEIVRFCKLFVPLGRAEIGRERFVSHICSIFVSLSITGFSKFPEPLRDIGGPLPAHLKVVAAPASALSPLSYVQCLSVIFELFARVVQKYEAELETEFGSGSAVALVRSLAALAEPYACKILDAAIEKFGVAQLVSEVALAKKQGSSGREAANFDPRTVSDLLELLCIFSNRAHSYQAFVATKLAAHPQPGQASAHISAPSASNATTDLQRKIQTILTQYIELEEYYIIQSIHRAIREDVGRTAQAGAQVSPMVDTVFFVLQKCCSRASNSHSINTLCTMLMIVNNCINIDFKEFLQNSVREKASVQSAGPKDGYMQVLNNVEVSADYLAKLRQEIDVQCDKLYTAPEEKEKIRVSLADLGDSAKSFKKVLQSNLEMVCNTISPRLRTLMEVFHNISYEMTEAEFTELEASGGDAWIERFTTQLDGILAPFKTNLTPTNYDMLLHIAIADLSTRLERAVLQKRFNQIGGLQLDKDLRKLVAYFAASSQLSVRADFARLTQIASLLNLTKASEVMDYWGENAGQMTWRLTPPEVRKVLSRRVDFSAAQIAALKLT